MRRLTRKGWIVGSSAMVVVSLLAAAVCYCLAGDATSSLVVAAERASLDTAATLALSAAAWLDNDRRETLERAATLMLCGTPVYLCVVSDGREQACVYEEGLGDLGATLRSIENGSAVLVLHQGLPVMLAATDLPLPQANSGRVSIGVDASYLVREIHGVQGRIAGIGIGAWLLVSLGVFALALSLSRHDRSGVAEEASEVVRGGKTADSTWLRVDLAGKSVNLAGTPIELTKKPFDLLSLLASEGGRVFSEEEILRELWPEAPYADSGDVRQCVYMLRKRMDEGVQDGGRCIVNVKGFGYKLDASCICTVHTEGER